VGAPRPDAGPLYPLEGRAELGPDRPPWRPRPLRRPAELYPQPHANLLVALGYVGESYPGGSSRPR
jgi:hypothetical protein